eukprot:632832-Alexandrium_andersonii.AAC.1
MLPGLSPRGPALLASPLIGLQCLPGEGNWRRSSGGISFQSLVAMNDLRGLHATAKYTDLIPSRLPPPGLQ